MPNPFDPDTIPDDQTPVDPTLEDLVGEGRKYKDPNELAKAYSHADAYINSLKAKDAEREAELKVLRDLVNARKEQGNTDPNPPVARQEPPEQPAPKTPEVDLNELVRKELSNAEAERQTANNINRAAEVMNTHFGSAAKAQEAIRRRAEELGVGVDWLRDAASKSPNAFFATMGINSRPTSTPSFTNEVRIGDARPNVRNMAYYENIRKTNPKLYYSAEMRKQEMDDARSAGASFFSN